MMILQTFLARFRLTLFSLVVALLLLFASPAFAAISTLVDSTANGAANNGTVDSGEYIASSAGINSGFGNVVGSGARLHVDSDNVGNIYLGLVTGGGSFDAAMVVYIDSVPGGYSSTGSFDDTGDACRWAISGYDGSNRSVLTFASGFQADYAICMDPAFAGVWQLAGSGPHPFVVSASRTTTTSSHFEMNLTLSNIGLAAGGGFKYVTTYR